MGSDSDAPVLLYIAAHANPDAAQADWDDIKELAKDKTIAVDGLVLVSRDADGKIHEKGRRSHGRRRHRHRRGRRPARRPDLPACAPRCGSSRRRNRRSRLPFREEGDHGRGRGRRSARKLRDRGIARATTFAAIETSKYRLDPNTYRLFADAAYLAWVAAPVVGALLIWATSALAFRTAILPHWYAWLGIVAAASQLFSLYLFPFLAWWIWLTLTAVLLTRQRKQRTTAVAHPAH